MPDPGPQTVEHAFCAGCQTVTSRYRITIYDLWHMPRSEGQRRTARLFYCESCWKIVRANLDQGARLAIMQEGASR